MVSSGPDGASDRLDRALLTYASGLAAAAGALRGHPYGELLLTLRQGRRILAGVGRLAQDAAWVEQREGYLVDAGERISDAAARLVVAVSAPLDSDLSVQIHATRDAVTYFRDIAADVIPAAAYRDPAVSLLAVVDRVPPAPGLYLQALPLVDRLLSELRRAGELAEELQLRAEAVLATPMPGYAAPAAPAAFRAQPAFEIEAILAELHRRAGAMGGAPREDATTYEVAIRDCFELTPGQLAGLLTHHVPFPS